MLEPIIFKHESLQDKNTIQEMLKSIAKAMSKGELTFSDDNGDIVLEPKGLLNVKVSARKIANEQRLDLRISWKTEEKEVKTMPLIVK